ncbi:glycoside hydrolase family 5 protein [Bacteroidota bacterium]
MRYILFLCLLVFLSCNNQSNQSTNSAKEEFKAKRGVNISHWLSQSRVRGEERAAYFTEEDVKFIASIGYDHIRLPIDEEQMWDEEGNKETEAFHLLHNALGWAKKQKLDVIVDLHIIRSHYFNSDDNTLWTDPKEQEKFNDLWRDLSGEFKKYPITDVAYELMNEAVADDPEDWNRLVANAITAVRKTEPERIIVVGSNMWQHYDTFHQLKVPDDPNLILSFHFYKPFLLTHYKTRWNDIRFYEGPVHYPGMTVHDEDITPELQEYLNNEPNRNRDFTIETIREMFQEPIRVAMDKGLPLYCGEFGCYPTVQEEDLLRWYEDMIMVLEECDIGWANWDYKGGFGIADSKTREPKKELIKTLLGEEAILGL